LSGPAVVAFCRGLGWEEVTSALRVSDDPANIREQFARTGGFPGAWMFSERRAERESGRGTTRPEATPRPLPDRIVPGFPKENAPQGSGAYADWRCSPRGTACGATKTLIVNLPGSPKGRWKSLERWRTCLPHA